MQPHLLGLVAQMCCFQYEEKENKLADGRQPCRSSEDGVACCVGVCGCAVCGVVWIATGFFCGNAAPGVKNPCEPCGGTGFVARNGGKFVPANLGMERDAADAAPASATSETTPEQQDALLRRLAESNVEITDEVCHRCEAATLARHEAATPQAWKAATACTRGLQLCVRQVRALALRVLSECDGHVGRALNRAELWQLRTPTPGTYGTPYQRHGRPCVNAAQLPPGSTLTDSMN